MYVVACWRSVKQEDDPPAAKKAQVDSFSNLRDGASSSTDQSTNAVLLSGRDELARYKAMQVPANYDWALEFWRQHATEYPVRLSEVARRVYCISASSAQSERDFSPVGHTITDVHSRLPASKQQSLCDGNAAEDILNISLNSLFLNDITTLFLICVMTVKNMRKYAWLTRSTRWILCIIIRHY